MPYHSTTQLANTCIYIHPSYVYTIYIDHSLLTINFIVEYLYTGSKLSMEVKTMYHSMVCI